MQTQATTHTHTDTHTNTHVTTARAAVQVRTPDAVRTTTPSTTQHTIQLVKNAAKCERQLSLFLQHHNESLIVPKRQPGKHTLPCVSWHRSRCPACCTSQATPLAHAPILAAPAPLATVGRSEMTALAAAQIAATRTSNGRSSTWKNTATYTWFTFR